MVVFFGLLFSYLWTLDIGYEKLCCHFWRCRGLEWWKYHFGVIKDEAVEWIQFTQLNTCLKFCKDQFTFSLPMLLEYNTPRVTMERLNSFPVNSCFWILVWILVFLSPSPQHCENTECSIEQKQVWAHIAIVSFSLGSLPLKCWLLWWDQIIAFVYLSLWLCQKLCWLLCLLEAFLYQLLELLSLSFSLSLM